MFCAFCKTFYDQLLHDPFVCCIVPCILKWICENGLAATVDLWTVLALAESSMGDRSGTVLHNYCILWRIHHDKNIRYILNYIAQHKLKQ